MHEIKLDTNSGPRIYLTAPYNEDANSKYRQVGGRWLKKSRRWSFARGDIELVRQVLMDVFGVTDIVDETVTTHVRVADWQWRGRRGHPGKATFGGRDIAIRYQRDTPVRVADGVVLVAGRFPSSGGSMAYPEIDAGEDVIVEVREVWARHRDLDHPHVTIVDQSVGREALLAERAELMRMVREIDETLTGDQ